MPDSVTQDVVCSDCGAQLPVGQDPPEPCPTCGSRTKTVRVGLHASIAATGSLSWAARSGNSVESRVRELGEAIGAIEASTGKISDEQAAAKRALEAIHELADCRRAGDWTDTGWSADDRGVWLGLIGARNCSHHSNSHVVVAEAGAGAGPQLKWDIDPGALAKLRSEAQRREYAARVQGQPVVDTLQHILGLLPRS